MGQRQDALQVAQKPKDSPLAGGISTPPASLTVLLETRAQMLHKAILTEDTMKIASYGRHPEIGPLMKLTGVTCPQCLHHSETQDLASLRCTHSLDNWDSRKRCI